MRFTATWTLERMRPRSAVCFGAALVLAAGASPACGQSTPVPERVQPLAASTPVPEHLRALAALMGQPAPAFSLPGADGGTVSLESVRRGDRVVVIQLWATWCIPCHFEALVNKQMLLAFGADDLMVVGLHSNDPSAVQIPEIRARLGMDYPVAVATDAVWSAYGDTPVLPLSLVIGRSGRVRRVTLGVHWVDEVEPILRKLTAETVAEARRAIVSPEDFEWGAPKPAGSAESAEAL